MEDPYKKIEEAAKKYWKGPKGRKTREKYLKSEKGKTARRRYSQSEKGNLASLRYYLSEKGREKRQQKTELNQLLSAYNKFLDENPNLTVKDFLAQLKEEDGQPT